MQFISQLVYVSDACQSAVPAAVLGGRTALPPAWSPGGEMLQGSGPPPAPHLGDGQSSSQKSHGHREIRGARKQNNHMTWEALPSCNNTETPVTSEVCMSLCVCFGGGLKVMKCEISTDPTKGLPHVNNLTSN